jgi:hypothetical protein
MCLISSRYEWVYIQNAQKGCNRTASKFQMQVYYGKKIQDTISSNNRVYKSQKQTKDKLLRKKTIYYKE